MKIKKRRRKALIKWLVLWLKTKKTKKKQKQTANKQHLAAKPASYAGYLAVLSGSRGGGGTHLKFSCTDFVHLVVCILQYISFLHQLHNLLGTGCQLTDTQEIDILLIYLFSVLFTKHVWTKNMMYKNLKVNYLNVFVPAWINHHLSFSYSSTLFARYSLWNWTLTGH